MICIANQTIGFDVMATLSINNLNHWPSWYVHAKIEKVKEKTITICSFAHGLFTRITFVKTPCCFQGVQRDRFFIVHFELTNINLVFSCLPWQPGVACHTEASHLITLEMNDFYMKCNTGPKRVELIPVAAQI